MSEDEIFEWPWPKGRGADHILSRQLELETLLVGRTPVFLDTNFWLMARDAAFGDQPGPELIELLGSLRLGVGTGRLIFPITDDLITEFSKQDPDSLAQTMDLVDRLSLGVAMIPQQERLVVAIERFFARVCPDHPPAHRPLWTSHAFAFGYQDLRVRDVEMTDDQIVRLAERAWMAPPSRCFDPESKVYFNAKAESERIAAMLNEGASAHAHEINGHATALRNEITGAATMIKGIVGREYRRIAEASGQTAIAADIAGSHRVGAQSAMMIAKALEQDDNRRLFGELYVPAMLHASVRSHAGRKFKPNDIFDFRHAAAALPHCRAFFTDGPLKAQMQSGHVKLDRLYRCSVASKPSEAIAILEELTLEPSAQE